MSTVKGSQADGILTLTLDRPQALNALDPATLGALGEALRAAAGDAAVRVVVLTGAGEKAFSAGADIAAMQGMAPGDGHAFARLGHGVAAAIEALPVPVVAAVNGVALGGGLELALACDLVVASERAKLGQPEINLGIIPGFGGTQRLVRRVGLAKARDLVYRGTVIAADEALRIGLVDRVVAPEKVRDEAHALATELATKAPLALRAAKRATAAAFDGDPAAGCRFEIEAFALTFATEDRAEGMKAFLEKRQPSWKAR
jgi:enoyl-CoA hydratase